MELHNQQGGVGSTLDHTPDMLHQVEQSAFHLVLWSELQLQTAATRVAACWAEEEGQARPHCFCSVQHPRCHLVVLHEFQ